MDESASKPKPKFAQPVDSAWKIIPCLQSTDIRTALRFYTEVLGFQGHSLNTRAPSPPPSSAAPEAQSEPRSSLPSRSRPETSAHGSADAKSEQASAAVEKSPHEPESTAAETSAVAAGSAGQQSAPPEPHSEPVAHGGADSLAATSAHVKSSHTADDDSEPEPDFCSVAAGAHAAANLYVFLNSPSQPVTASWVLIALSTAQLERLWHKLSAIRYEGAAERSSYADSDGVWKVAIIEEIGDRPWGYRQFSVLDPDKNKISFFRFLEGGNVGDDVDDAE